MAEYTIVSDLDQATIISVSGEIDSYTAPELKEALREMLDAGKTHLILDLEHVRYMSSEGFALLLSIHKAVRRAEDGGYLRLANLSEDVAQVFRILALDSYFEIYPSLAEALAGF